MKKFSGILGVILFIGCLWASFKIPLWEEWPDLKQSPWFLVTLLDLYIGLILFAGFTYWFKRNGWHTLIWSLLFFSLGNMATIIWIWKYWGELNAKLKA